MFSQKNINRPSDHLQSNNLHPIEVKQVPTFINTSNHSSEKLSSLTQSLNKNNRSNSPSFPNISANQPKPLEIQNSQKISFRSPHSKRARNNYSMNKIKNQNKQKDQVTSPAILQSIKICSQKQDESKRQLLEICDLKILEIKELVQKSLETVKKMDLRISDIEKQNERTSLEKQKLIEISEIKARKQKQEEQKMNLIKQEVMKVKNQIKFLKENDGNKMVTDLPKQEYFSNYIVGSSIEEKFQSFKRQIQIILTEFKEKYSYKIENLSVFMNKIDEQMKNNLTSIKSSPIKCSGSAILLRFIESFKVRKNCEKKTENKILLTDNTYYIDQQGYLLDKNQHYLIGLNENKIKLEERHIKRLKQEQILQ